MGKWARKKLEIKAFVDQVWMSYLLKYKVFSSMTCVRKVLCNSKVGRDYFFSLN